MHGNIGARVKRKEEKVIFDRGQRSGSAFPAPHHTMAIGKECRTDGAAERFAPEKKREVLQCTDPTYFVSLLERRAVQCTSI